MDIQKSILASDTLYNVCQRLQPKDIKHLSVLFPQLPELLGKSFWTQYIPFNVVPYRNGSEFDWSVEAYLRQEYSELLHDGLIYSLSFSGRSLSTMHLPEVGDAID